MKALKLTSDLDEFDKFVIYRTGIEFHIIEGLLSFLKNTFPG
jgi:hypothetical protein